MKKRNILLTLVLVAFFSIIATKTYASHAQGSAVGNRQEESLVEAGISGQDTWEGTQSSEIQAQKAPQDFGSRYFSQVKFTDISGNSLAKVNESDKIKVLYDFEIPGDVHENEKMTIQLPEQLQMVNYLDFPILDSKGNIIATASTDQNTGRVSLVFTKEVEEKTDIIGSLFFWVKMDKNKVVEGLNSFNMPCGEMANELILNVKKSNGLVNGTTNPTVIFKNGTLDKNDPSLINWTIMINNAHQNLLQPEVSDEIGSGQMLVSGTFSFNYRDVNKKSLEKFTLPHGDDVGQDDTNVKINEKGFSMSLENLGSYSLINHFYSVVVTYKTKILSPSSRYVNSAQTSDELGQIQKRNASIIDYGGGGIASGNTQEGVDNLTNTLDNAMSLDSQDLSPEAAEQLTKATENAQSIVDEGNTTLEELDAASHTLEKVVQDVTPEVIPPVDEEITKALKALQELVEETQSKDPTKYTATTWDNVIKALSDAEALLHNESTTPGSSTLEKIQLVHTKLNQALRNLIDKDQERLQNALNNLQTSVEKIEQMDNSPYTKESWGHLIQVKEEAKELIDVGFQKVKLAEVQKKQFQLQRALEDLVVIKPIAQGKVKNENKNLKENPLQSERKNLPLTGDFTNTVALYLGLVFVSLSILFHIRTKRRTK